MNYSLQFEMMDGDAWQDLIVQCLILRYGHQFEAIPAKHAGDLGLDGVSHSDGTAYQCYAPQEPLSTAERYEKQRIKMNTDLSKLEDNCEKLKTLLGGTLIATWVFVVPKHDSRELNLYAGSKEKEYRKKNLPILSPQFRIAIEDAKYFAAEIQSLVNSALAKIGIEADEISEAAATDWASQNDKLVQTLDEKLLRAEAIGKSRLVQYRTELLRIYLQGQNVLENLSNHYPKVYQDVIIRKRSRQRYLVMDNPHSTKRIPDVKAAFAFELTENVKALRNDTAELLAAATIVGWLIECPLHPKVVANGT